MGCRSRRRPAHMIPAGSIAALFTRRRKSRPLSMSPRCGPTCGATGATWPRRARGLMFAAIRSADSLARYQQASQAAHDRGVFGVPTMLIGNTMWWGNDRLDFVEEYLKARAQPSAPARTSAPGDFE